jgi:hypothetical protein
MRSGLTDQAENKLHMNKAVLAFLMAELGAQPRGGISRGAGDEA